MVKKFTINIIRLFLNDYGKSFYLRELAASLGKPHQTIKPYAEELATLGILTKTERKNLTEYRLNLKDKRVYDYLVIAEKDKLMERLQEDLYLRTLHEKLSILFDKCTFVIFGSAVGKIQKGSDIDLLAIGRYNIIKLIKDFEDIYNKKIHKIQAANLRKLNETFIKEIYKKHLIFNNTEQIVRFFGELHGQNKLV